MIDSETLADSPLGKSANYPSHYSPQLLFAIPRKLARDVLNLHSPLPFHGTDMWTGYELSWLNQKGKPQIAIAEFQISCDSEKIIESKSFKMYLNSLNQTQFKSQEEVQSILKKDLSEAVKGAVQVNLFLPDQFKQQGIHSFSGQCLDELDIEIDTYQPSPLMLIVGSQIVQESLFSHLFKSNCPVTGQPDWASILIHYQGRQIDHEGLLRYLISYRFHEGFHEQCVEKIFKEIMDNCQPTKLTVYARYTRRGGLDINPYRSNFEIPPENFRLVRQ